MSNFKDLLIEYKEYVDKHLDTYLNTSYNRYEEKLHESMKYTLMAGGKRLRAILLIEIAKLYGVSVKDSIDYAAAIEMIHAYSLIHDDLPCMDDDDLRRNKPTNHIMYGEDIALLAGDALLNYSYEVMLKNFKSDNYLNAMRVIANSAGHKGMISGQIGDIYPGTKTLEDILYIYYNKTSALITASILAGAYIGNASEEDINKLKEFGNNLGLIFQIRDDLLDITSSSEELGKTVNSDEKNNKITYLSLHGVEKSNRTIEKLTKESIDIIKSISNETDFLVDIIKFLSSRSY